MDVDGDGIRDLASGSYQPGSIYWFPGLGEGRFDLRRELTNAEGDPVNASHVADFHEETRNFRRDNASDPRFFDWDADGDLDLLVGSMEGEVSLFLDEGEPGRPAFQVRGTLVRHGERPIRVRGGLAAPETADWNGDGLVDLLVGSGSGEVAWFENVGERGAPSFAEGEILIEAAPQRSVLRAGELPRRGRSVRISAADHDGDGRLDLLVGDYQTVAYLRDDLSAEENAESARLVERIRELEASLDRAARVREDEMWNKGYRPTGIFARYAEGLDVWYEQLDEAREQIAPFVDREVPHGFVWLFRRRD